MHISLRLNPERDRHSIEVLSSLDSKEHKDIICDALRRYRKGMDLSFQLDPECDQDIIEFLESFQNPEREDVVRQALEFYLERDRQLSKQAGSFTAGGSTMPQQQVFIQQLEMAAGRSVPKVRSSNEELSPETAAELGKKLDSMFKF